MEEPEPPLPTSRSQSDAAKATRKAIFEAAFDEFAEKGRAGASMRAIARRAGCPQSLLHHHFGTKDGLWQEVTGEIVGRWLRIGGKALDDPAPSAAAVKELLAALWAFWLEDLRATRLNAWRQLEGVNADEIAQSREGYERMARFFERAQASGAVRDDVPVAILVLTVYGAITQACLGAAASDFEGLPFLRDRAAIVDQLYRVIAPPTP